jgi:tetratricopeptide (TPR) repeat protein
VAWDAGNSHYLGPETCELCHKTIGEAQERTAMANTWQGRLSNWLPPSFDASVSDDFSYQLQRTGDSLTYSVSQPGEQTINLPVSILMGGQRHGLGFLVSMKEVAGIPLARPALVQARYEWSPEKKKLLLAPGCAATKPQSLEQTLGLVLSPTFEERCLSCHGQPNLSGTGKNGGVHCESCHGPGSQHLAAIARGEPAQGIINPKRLSTEDSIGVCARCHVGLARFSDPSPDDLLVANQVRAIRSSECFLQSGKAFSCTTCHDPHNDAAADSKKSISACLGCHAQTAKLHAAICPVNATGGCIGCHMPSVEMGPLHLVDHTIRVHPETASEHPAALRTQVRPISEYLRIIATNTSESATAAHDRLSRGESFYALARELSVDHSSAIGGYLGRKTLSDLGNELSNSAAELGYGETSKVIHAGERWIILQRLPRDFRWNAESLQRQAEQLAAHGDAQAAIKKAQEALMIYPQFLRAISFIGITFAQNGNPKKAAEVLATATRLYPDDAGAEFALASVLNLQGDQSAAREAFKRVIALEPDFTAAYANLGMILYSSNDLQEAIKTFRAGLQIDPMSAELYHDLGQALTKSGDTAGGAQANNLARKLDIVMH